MRKVTRQVKETLTQSDVANTTRDVADEGLPLKHFPQNGINHWPRSASAVSITALVVFIVTDSCEFAIFSAKKPNTKQKNECRTFDIV